MLIAYDSKTGNVQRFIESLALPAADTVRITPGLVVSEPFVLVTYTTGFGDIPPSTVSFLQENHLYLTGIATSGNKIWGANFGKSADTISEQYRVPTLLKFELSGLPTDKRLFMERVEELAHETHRTEQPSYQTQRQWLF